jgi:hypothetical protein
VVCSVLLLSRSAFHGHHASCLPHLACTSLGTCAVQAPEAASAYKLFIKRPVLQCVSMQIGDPDCSCYLLLRRSL